MTKKTHDPPCPAYQQNVVVQQWWPGGVGPFGPSGAPVVPSAPGPTHKQIFGALQAELARSGKAARHAKTEKAKLKILADELDKPKTRREVLRKRVNTRLKAEKLAQIGSERTLRRSLAKLKL